MYRYDIHFKPGRRPRRPLVSSVRSFSSLLSLLFSHHHHHHHDCHRQRHRQRYRYCHRYRHHHDHHHHSPLPSPTPTPSCSPSDRWQSYTGSSYTGTTIEEEEEEEECPGRAALGHGIAPQQGLVTPGGAGESPKLRSPSKKGWLGGFFSTRREDTRRAEQGTEQGEGTARAIEATPQATTKQKKHRRHHKRRHRPTQDPFIPSPPPHLVFILSSSHLHTRPSPLRSPSRSRRHPLKTTLAHPLLNPSLLLLFSLSPSLPPSPLSSSSPSP